MDKMLKEKIAYIHGYNGSPNDVSFNILSKRLNKYYEIIGIDYDKENIDIEHIKLYLKSLGISRVIGTSLGGFITLNLGSEFKKIVFNPCMKPSIELPKIGASKELITKYANIENIYYANLVGDDLDISTTCGFFGDSDELFGPHGYKFLFKSYYHNAYNMKCGHQIEDTAIKKIVYRIKNFLHENN